MLQKLGGGGILYAAKYGNPQFSKHSTVLEINLMHTTDTWNFALIMW